MAWTINEIKQRMRDAGSHWFDPDTMRFFGTGIGREVYDGPGGVYFVTSEQPPHGPRCYTVREFVLTPDGPDIGTVGEFCEIRTMREAKLKARKLAQGNGKLDHVYRTDEAYKPIGDFEQFCYTLDREVGAVGQANARRLVTAAKKHKTRCESLCNGQRGAMERVESTEKELRRLCTRLEIPGVVFSRDPRGCTVKLVVESGFTDDWGKTGFCVPQGALV